VKKNPILFGLTLLIGGCVHQNLTEVPAFSGTVVDADTGVALEGVSFGRGVTDANGRFSLPAIAHKVWNFPAPGAGRSIERRLVFRKQGYRDMTCLCKNFALYAEDNRATIPMVEESHSEPATGTPIFLHLNDNIGCQAYVGSWVRYKGQQYVIGEIYTRTRDDREQTLFSLWPVPPADAGVMDVMANDLLLTTRQRR